MVTLFVYALLNMTLVNTVVINNVVVAKGENAIPR
jgi:hypothetical protein